MAGVAFLNVWSDDRLWWAAMIDAKKDDVVRVGPVASKDPLAACVQILGLCCKRCGANPRKSGEKYCQGCASTVIRQLHASPKCLPIPYTSWSPRDPVGRYSVGGQGEWENAVGLLEDFGDCEGIGECFGG